MPEPGSRLSQSAYVLEMLSIMDHTYGQIEEYMHEEAKKGKKPGQPSPHSS